MSLTASSITFRWPARILPRQHATGVCKAGPRLLLQKALALHPSGAFERTLQLIILTASSVSAVNGVGEPQRNRVELSMAIQDLQIMHEELQAARDELARNRTSHSNQEPAALAK
jgi:hypothetical protein